MENKPPVSYHTLFFVFMILVILISFMARVVFGDKMTEEESDKIIQLIETVEKKIAVQNIKHTEIKGPRYTIRIGYDGARKPIPRMTGLTTDERAKQLLDTVGIGHTLPIWKKFGEKYGIDYTLPISIGFADSHLGKALKSKHNIGNIGNNDRGDVKHFDSLEAGIEAIFWTLAKGKYMSGHGIIGTLSGEGRKRLGLPGCNEEKDYRKKCYASSMGVWSTNVVNIMSAIKNEQIDENFEFRLK